MQSHKAKEMSTPSPKQRYNNTGVIIFIESSAAQLISSDASCSLKEKPEIVCFN